MRPFVNHTSTPLTTALLIAFSCLFVSANELPTTPTTPTTPTAAAKTPNKPTISALTSPKGTILNSRTTFVNKINHKNSYEILLSLQDSPESRKFLEDLNNIALKQSKKGTIFSTYPWATQLENGLLTTTIKFSGFQWRKGKNNILTQNELLIVTPTGELATEIPPRASASVSFLIIAYTDYKNTTKISLIPKKVQLLIP